MKKIIILSLLFIPVYIFAQSQESITLGEGGIVSFTEVIEADTTTFYYNEEELVLSIHDTDGDSVDDIWIMYTDDIASLEAYDTTGDGDPDIFMEIGTDELVKEMYGEDINIFQAPEVILFESLTADSAEINEPEDLVGDISKITIPGGNNWLLYLILLLILAGTGYWWMKRQNN